MNQRDEVGMIGGMEGVVLGVLVFVIGTLVIVNAWAIVDTKLAAAAAAREATRAYVEAPNESAAVANAKSAADQTLAGYGRKADRATIDLSEATLERCAPATITIRYSVPLISLPLIGQMGGVITTTGRHTEIVDPYRAGTPVNGNGDACG